MFIIKYLLVSERSQLEKGKNRRHGKIVPGGHTTRVTGLTRFLTVLEQWSEITSIHLGHIQQRSSARHRSKSPKPAKSSKSGRRGTQAHERAKVGNNFSFKVARPAMIGPRITGINCYASDGTCVQLIVLCSDNIDALKLRLQNEGYEINW